MGSSGVTLQRRMQLLVAAVGLVLLAVVVLLIGAMSDFRDDVARRDSLASIAAASNDSPALERLVDEAIADAEASRDRFVATVVAAMATAGVLLLVGGIALRYWVVLPIRRLSRAVAAVGAGALDGPIEAEGSHELRVLGDAVSRMRDRIIAERDEVARADQAVQQQAPAVAAMRTLLEAAHGEPPAGIEVAGRLIPAEGVLAGDWYDLVRSDGRFLMAIGDVCGHGIDTGEFAIRTKFALLDAMMLGLDPEAAIELSARRYGERENFVTAMVVELDPAARRLRYSNAGFNPGVVLRENGEAVDLPATGPLIGPLVAPHPNREVDLQPGDVVALFTDGLVEARDAEREPFGRKRVCDVIETNRLSPVDQLVELVLGALRSFVGGPPTDDLTVVIARVSL